MSLKKIYIRNNSTISGRLHDELVMMNIEKGRYFSLNPVATRIWDLLEQPMSAEELCMRLKEEYEVDETTCRQEANDLLKEMKKLGLVSYAHEKINQP
jgi:hypothetical protein